MLLEIYQNLIMESNQPILKKMLDKENQDKISQSLREKDKQRS